MPRTGSDTQGILNDVMTDYTVQHMCCHNRIYVVMLILSYMVEPWDIAKIQLFLTNKNSTFMLFKVTFIRLGDFRNVFCCSFYIYFLC